MSQTECVKLLVSCAIELVRVTGDRQPRHRQSNARLQKYAIATATFHELECELFLHPPHSLHLVLLSDYFYFQT